MFQKAKFIEKLYQDLFGLARMFHYENISSVDYEILAVQT